MDGILSLNRVRKDIVILTIEHSIYHAGNLGGRAKQYLNQWKILTSDNEILGIIQGLGLELTKIPHQCKMAKQRNFTESESIAIDDSIPVFQCTFEFNFPSEHLLHIPFK
jgi:hypothetical protein